MKKSAGVGVVRFVACGIALNALGRVAAGGDMEAAVAALAAADAVSVFVPQGMTEKAAFLGVVAQPADESLSRQLGLTKGTGLIVRHVESGSPADGKIELFDVLRAFEGQVLVNQEQLAVLVRTNKPGATVSIDLTRQAKPVTVTVKLAEKEMPVMIRSSTGMAIDPQFMMLFGGTNSPVKMQIRGSTSGGASCLAPFTGAGTSSKTISSQFIGTSGTTTMSNDNHTLTLTTKGGTKTLRVTTREGKELFNGPINTEEERAKVPASLRDELKEMDSLTVEVAPQAD